MKKLLILQLAAVVIKLLAGIQLLHETAYALPDCGSYCQCGSGSSHCNDDPLCHGPDEEVQLMKCNDFGVTKTCMLYCCEMPCNINL